MGALVLVGRADVGGQQVAERVHGEVHLAALALLVAVVAAALAALDAARQGAGIQHDRRGLLVSAGHQAPEHAQVGGDCLEDPGPQPALALLVDDLSGRGKFVGIKRQGAPARTIQRRALKTARRLCSRWGASWRIRHGYGATKFHSSSETSLG